MNSESTTARVEAKIYSRMEKYCKKNGIKIGWFTSRAIECKLNDVLSEDSE